MSSQPGRSRSSSTSRRLPAVHAGLAARAPAIRILIPKNTRNLQENSQSNFHVDHLAGQCTVLGDDTHSAAREVSLDTLHRSVQAGRNGNKHAMVPTCQGDLTAAAAENDDSAPVDNYVATADAPAAAAADVARGAVKPTAADDNDDAARGAVKPTVVDTARRAVKSTTVDYTDGLCRHTCHDHHRHGLRSLLEPRRRAPGRCLAALHLWARHGYHRHFRPSSWSP